MQCRMADTYGSATCAGIYTLPLRVVHYEGIPWRSWMTKCVTLMNVARLDVAKGICHNASFDLVIDNDNQPLGDDCGVVQIAESLFEEDVPSNWLFQLQSWHM